MEIKQKDNKFNCLAWAFLEIPLLIERPSPPTVFGFAFHLQNIQPAGNQIPDHFIPGLLAVPLLFQPLQSDFHIRRNRNRKTPHPHFSTLLSWVHRFTEPHIQLFWFTDSLSMALGDKSHALHLWFTDV